MAAADSPRIVIAGGGVAGLEACLALRSFLGEDELHIDLLCREHRFEYRPLAVLEPFDGAPAWTMELERFAADQDVRLIRDSLAAVEPDRHEAITAYSGRLAYDALLVCVGARAVRALARGDHLPRRPRRRRRPGRAGRHAAGRPRHDRVRGPLRRLLDAAALRAGDPRRRAPARAGVQAQVVMTSPEAAPLEAFGADASVAVAASSTLAASSSSPAPRDRGRRRRGRARRRPADRGRAVDHAPRPGRPARPRPAAGRRGLHRGGRPRRVPGADGVYAAGDVTNFPLKQGGLATQQADAAVEAMLAALGVPLVPRPFEPVLKGVLYTDRRAGLSPGHLGRPGLGAPRVRHVVAAEQDRRAPPGALSRDPRRRAARARGAARARRHPGHHRHPARGARRLRTRSIRAPCRRADPSASRIAVRGSYGWRAPCARLASTTCPRSSSPAAASPASKR